MSGEVFYSEFGVPVGVPAGGRSGGEGRVVPLADGQALCAKLYHPERLTPERELKVAAMIESPPQDPTWERIGHRSLAWPVHALYREAGWQRGFAGFTMPLLGGSHVHTADAYYDPPDRIRHFGGGFTFRHLMVTAANVASAVAAVHERGHRVGDLRETNIFVWPTALIALLDCDSMQIHGRKSGTTFPCRVGTGEYLPPELQGVDFGARDVDRLHGDRFALAVLVFKLLMAGVHPFQAVGSAVDDAPTTEAKVRKGLYPYARGMREVSPPPYAPPKQLISPPLAQLFERAFVEGHSDPEKRPSSVEWHAELRTSLPLLRNCSANRHHWHPDHLDGCPWCQLAERGRDLFPAPVALEGIARGPLQERMDAFRGYVELAAVDGDVDTREEQTLLRLAAELRIPEKQARRLIADGPARA